MSSFLVLQNDNSLSESFGKISWGLLDTVTASSHSFCQTWCKYSAVQGFKSEKGTRSSIGFLSRASLAAPSAAYRWFNVECSKFFLPVTLPLGVEAAPAGFLIKLEFGCATEQPRGSARYGGAAAQLTFTLLCGCSMSERRQRSWTKYCVSH